MNAEAFRKWAKAEYDREMAEARLRLDTRLQAAKYMEKSERSSASANGRRGASATLSPVTAESGKPSAPAVGTAFDFTTEVPPLGEAIQQSLSGRVGHSFKMKDAQAWVAERFPTLTGTHSAWHRALSKLAENNVIRIKNPGQRGNAGLTYEVVNPNQS